MQALTESQAKLAADNYGLVFSYMYSKHITCYENTYKDNDDWHGLLAEALCKAAMTYDESQNITFSTYAYTCMNHAMGMYFKSRNSKKRVPENMLDYYDIPNDDNENETKMDTISGPYNVESEVESNLFLEQLFTKQKEKHRIVYQLLIDGYSITEIAKKLGVSKQSVSQMLQRDRKIVEKI